ncbi:MAG: helicase-related protein [Bacteroidota bacterium]
MKELLQEQGFFADPEKRLLIFTEFKDTLDYLVESLRDWGFKVGVIHGGMKPGSRDEPGSRIYAEQLREGGIQILVATEAAGEGINLQVCHIMFNYDIPWNPNRLEQRMGRIHRYGQLKDCLIFNFVATNTIEGKVLQRLLAKLQEIRDAMDDDAVFNVVGEILPAAHIERVLRDYYADRLGDADLEDRLLRNVDEKEFRAICQNALEGLASKKLNLAMLVERRALAQERRLVPEAIARFLKEAAAYANLEIKDVSGLTHTFDLGRTPACLKRYERDADWRLPALASRYPRCTTDRKTADEYNLEWITPGHPLFEAVRRHTHGEAAQVFGSGYERSQGRQVFDVHEKNLSYDITSLDLNSGELRLIEVKGLAAASGTILLTPNERRVAEDRRDCYWLYVVTNCGAKPELQEPIKDPARFPWHEVTKVQHYWLEVNAMTKPIMVREEKANYGDEL